MKSDESRAARICAIRPSLYNAAGCPQPTRSSRATRIELLNDGPEGWVDLVFADPPFNIGYLYHGYDDEKDVDEYVDWSEKWMRAVHRALKPTGSFYLAIGDEFAADLCLVARRKIGFHLRNWIIWHYTFGQQTKKMFAKSHTHILYFTKSEETDFTFNADAVRVASARQTTYADTRANPKGKLPDDTWFLRPQEAAPHAYFEPGCDTWNDSRVCGTFKEREGLARLPDADRRAEPHHQGLVEPGRRRARPVQRQRHDGRVRGPAGAEVRRHRPVRGIRRLRPQAPRTCAAANRRRQLARVKTATDAFGRPRVERKRAVKTA